VSDQKDIPVLTDVIDKGGEIKMSDLGLDDDLEIEVDQAYGGYSSVDAGADEQKASDIFNNNPALEYAVQSILDQHMELAWQEIKKLIQSELDKRQL
jgi:hypothetical protein